MKSFGDLTRMLTVNYELYEVFQLTFRQLWSVCECYIGHHHNLSHPT